MSFTNSRRVPGSSIRFIIRAAAPATSGSDANSRKLTRITPSVAAIGAGNGSLLWPGGSGAGGCAGGWPNAGAVIDNASRMCSRRTVIEFLASGGAASSLPRLDRRYARTAHAEPHQVFTPDHAALEHLLDLVDDLFADRGLVDLREQVRQHERL